MSGHASDATRTGGGAARLRRALAAVGAAAVLLVPGSARAQEDRGLALLNAANGLYEGVETVCGDFVQRLEIPLLGEETTGAGRLCQRRPNLFAMRFTDPDGDAVVGDGAAVWAYFPSSDPRTVLKTSPDRAAGGYDFQREFLVEPELRYDVRYEDADRIDGVPTHRLRLTPKGPAGYRSAVVWIDQGEPVLRRVRIEEENGTLRTITLSNVEFDADPGLEWFTFTPPRGAAVIEG